MFVVLMASQMVCLAAKSFSWKIKIILTDADMLTCPGPAVLCFALAGIFSSAVKRFIGSTIGFHNHRVGAFNQEKALVGAFSVIVKTGCGTDGSFYSTTHCAGP